MLLGCQPSCPDMVRGGAAGGRQATPGWAVCSRGVGSATRRRRRSHTSSARGAAAPPGTLASLGAPAAKCPPMGTPAPPAVQQGQRPGQRAATRWRHGCGGARQRPRRRRPAAGAPKNAPACASRPGRCPWATWSRSAALQGGAWRVWGSAGTRRVRGRARTWGVHAGRATPERPARRPCLAASRLPAALPAVPAASTGQGLARGTPGGPD